MEPPPNADQNQRPFLFACYSHADNDRVYPAIAELSARKLNVWYDEGIEAGTRWRDSLANAIENSSALIFFVSRHSIRSEHCLKEVNYAVENSKPIVCAYLEEVVLPPGLRLYLGDLQAIYANQTDFQDRLTSAASQLLVGTESAGPASAAARRRPITRSPIRLTIALALICLLIVMAGLVLLKPWSLSAIPEASVAVLPFDYWGSEELSYISDGIAEEIMNSLTQVAELKVAARGSAFSFRDRKDDVNAIGESLKVRHLVDGSVQKQGDRIKITVYLIDASDGSTLWSDATEAPSEDVFDLQQRIALGVLTALNGRVGLAASFEPEYEPTDPKAYEEFLLGRHLWRQRGEQRIRAAIGLFESAVERDPQFGRAWSALAFAYITLPTYSRTAEGAHAKAEQYARRALSLDPSLGEAYATLGVIHGNQRDWLRAGRYHREALTLEPNNPDIMSMYEEFAADMGHTNASLNITLRGYEIDPVNMRSNMGAGWALSAVGRTAEGIFHFERAWSISRIEPVWRGKFVALIELNNFVAAEAWLTEHPNPDRMSADVAFLNGRRDPDQAMNAVAVIMQETLDGRLGTIFGAVMLGSLDQPDATYELIELLDARGRRLNLRGIWWHSNITSRQDPRLTEVARARRLIPYWQEFGPPDTCNLLPSGVLNCFQ